MPEFKDNQTSFPFVFPPASAVHVSVRKGSICIPFKTVWLYANTFMNFFERVIARQVKTGYI